MDDLGDNLLCGRGGAVGVDEPGAVLEDRTDRALGWLMGWCMRAMIASAVAGVVVLLTGLGALAAGLASVGNKATPLNRCDTEECVIIPTSELRRLIDMQVEKRLREDSDPAECWRMRV